MTTGTGRNSVPTVNGRRGVADARDGEGAKATEMPPAPPVILIANDKAPLGLVDLSGGHGLGYALAVTAGPVNAIVASYPQLARDQRRRWAGRACVHAPDRASRAAHRAGRKQQ